MPVSQSNPKLTSAQLATVNAKTTRAYYKFAFWSYDADSHWEYDKDSNKEIDVAEEVFAGDSEFYAIWQFVGGTAAVVGETIVHNRPLMEIGGGAELQGDGTIEVKGGGQIKYKFPDDVDGEDANDYDYFVIDRTAAQTTGNPDTNWNDYADASWTGNIGNRNPWATNADWLIRDVAGANGTGGFTITHGTSSYKIKFNSLTFYKAPRYTVSFDWNLEGLDPSEFSEIDDMVDVWGKDDRFDGFGVGSANWPKKSLGTDVDIDGKTYWFVGWSDDGTYDGNLYIYSTPITADTVLKAVWVDERPDSEAYVTATNASVGVYTFDLEAVGKTWADVKGVSFKVYSPTEYASNGGGDNLRTHVINPTVATPDTNGQWACEWGAGRILTIHENQSFTTVFGDKGVWKTITMDFSANDPNPASKPAATANKLNFGIGVGVNQNAAGGGTVTYFIKDVVLTMTAGDDVSAAELDDDNIGWVLRSSGFSGTAIREFKPFME